MGNFSLDKYQAMKPLYVQALDISKTVDILSEAEKQNDVMSNLKKTDAVVGLDTEARDSVYQQAAKEVDAAADSTLNPLDKGKYVQRAATAYVNNPLLEAYGKSVAQQKQYTDEQIKRVEKGDIKDEDAALGAEASLLAHNYKGGTDPNKGNYFMNSTYQIPAVVDKQGIISKIKNPASGYKTEREDLINYDQATGEVRMRTVKNGREEWLKGETVGKYLYENNEAGIRDRDIWDSKKEIARQLVNDGKYQNMADAFIAVDQNRNGDFTNRLQQKVNEKAISFISNLSAQTNFVKTESSLTQSLNPGAVPAAGSEKQATELVIDTTTDVHTLSMSDDDLDNLDLDKFLQENDVNSTSIKDVTKALSISPMLGGGYSYTSGSEAEKAKKAQADYIETVKTIQDLRDGNAAVLKRYGISSDEWKNLPREEQNIKIKALIKQRKNTSSTVGILEANNNNVYKSSLDNASDIFVFNHNKNSYEKVSRKDIKAKYLDNGGWFSSSISEEDAKQLKQNSNFKSENSSGGIDSYEELANHLSSSKTPVLAFDFTGYKVKPYLQFNYGDQNSSVRVPVSDITESALVPLQTAFKEFKNPTGGEVKIAPHLELAAGGNYVNYDNLTAKWIDGTYTILSNGKPTTLTLEKLATGVVGRQINNLNTTANAVKVKANKPEGGK